MSTDPMKAIQPQLDQIAHSVNRLQNSMDAINAVIGAMDDKLGSMRIGVPVTIDLDDDGAKLGYQRHSAKGREFTFVVIYDKEPPVHWKITGRDAKIQILFMLPTLVRALAEETEKTCRQSGAGLQVHPSRSHPTQGQQIMTQTTAKPHLSFGFLVTATSPSGDVQCYPANAPICPAPGDIFKIDVDGAGIDVYFAIIHASFNQGTIALEPGDGHVDRRISQAYPNPDHGGLRVVYVTARKGTGQGILYAYGSPAGGNSYPMNITRGDNGRASMSGPIAPAPEVKADQPRSQPLPPPYARTLFFVTATAALSRVTVPVFNTTTVGDLCGVEWDPKAKAIKVAYKQPAGMKSNDQWEWVPRYILDLIGPDIIVSMIREGLRTMEHQASSETNAIRALNQFGKGSDYGCKLGDPFTHNTRPGTVITTDFGGYASFATVVENDPALAVVYMSWNGGSTRQLRITMLENKWRVVDFERKRDEPAPRRWYERLWDSYLAWRDAPAPMELDSYR